MRLADIVDLEAQLAQDAGEDRERLHARDRALLGDDVTGSRHRLLLRWLAAMRRQEPGRVFPGRRVVAALRAVTALLVVLGLGAGWGTASVVLHYDGSRPVNVWDVLLVLVGLQLVLLFFLLVSFAAPIASIGVPLFGALRSLLQHTWRALAFRTAAASDRGRALAPILARLRARHRLYAGLEAWSLLVLTQSFAVAFNAGALAAFLRLVVFTDLAFAWSTTLELDSPRFHELVSALAAPWATLVPEAVPTRELVEATRWSRLEGAYVHASAAGALRAGGWWPFLAMALATYGLLPRIVTLTAALARRAWRIGHLPFDDVEIAGLVARLTHPVVSTRSPAAEGPAPPAASAAAPRAARAHPGESCRLVLWRDVPPDGVETRVRRQLGYDVATTHTAGGRDPRALAATCADLSRSRGPVVVAAEAWEAPDDATLAFVRELRACAGEQRALVVFLFGSGSDAPPAAADLDVWARRLGALADPYLAMEPLEP